MPKAQAQAEAVLAQLQPAAPSMRHWNVMGWYVDSSVVVYMHVYTFELGR
jgi:hypothetical protein